jgi:hypothetical protein
MNNPLEIFDQLARDIAEAREQVAAASDADQEMYAAILGNSLATAAVKTAFVWHDDDGGDKRNLLRWYLEDVGEDAFLAQFFPDEDTGQEDDEEPEP